MNFFDFEEIFLSFDQGFLSKKSLILEALRVVDLKL